MPTIKLRYLVQTDGLSEILVDGLLDYGVDAEDAETEEAALAPADCDCYLFETLAPDHTGLRLLSELKRRGVYTPVIVTSETPDVRSAVEAIKLGADDFVVAAKSIDGVAAAILKAARQSAARRPGRVGAGVFSALTSRQAEILLLTASGMTSKEIARELDISHRTVENYRARAMDRLGLSRRIDMIRLVLESVNQLSTATRVPRESSPLRARSGNGSARDSLRAISRADGSEY
jgi:DNA-binding NarL/FixJ family response regulator